MNQTDGYSASQLFENWSDSFVAYELVTDKDGIEDLRIVAANRTFANMISADWETLPGRMFKDACPMAVEWLPFYIDCAKTGNGNVNESYNYDLQKFLTAIVFSPKIGEVAMMVIDRTHLWESDQKQRGRDKDFALLFSSMSSGFCLGKIIRNEKGEAVDVLFEMVNSAFEILEGFPTATAQGKRLFELKDEDISFARFVEVADKKTRATFTKQVSTNSFTLEVVCFSQGEDLIVCIENNITERVKAENALKEAHETIVSSINYASKIQKNLLPDNALFKQAFEDYSIIWKPRDIVGGDIYWIKNFSGGTVLSVCDCTGHGTPGALLTMLVVSAFEDLINEDNCHDTADIMWKLEQRLVSVLRSNVDDDDLDIKDGCDLAILFIAKDGSVTISSSHIHVFVCDGKEVTQIKGQNIYIGGSKLNGKDEIKTTHLPSNPDNKFYIASDGLYDQVNEADKPFGYKPFKKLILENHNESQAAISEKIWGAFEEYKGTAVRLDDFELITFKI